MLCIVYVIDNLSLRALIYDINKIKINKMDLEIKSGTKITNISIGSRDNYNAKSAKQGISKDDLDFSGSRTS